MKANINRRLLAFLIDIIIVTILFYGITLLIPKNHNVKVLESQITELRSDYLRGEINTSIYINRYANVQKDLDKQNIPINVLNLIFIFGYFSLVPYYWDGKTIGKKIFKLRITKENKKEKVSLNDYLIRTLIINGAACTLLSQCVVFLLNDFNYFLITIICGFIQFLLVIISVFMIIYRHDKKGVHDLLSRTQVIKEG